MNEQNNTEKFTASERMVSELTKMAAEKIGKRPGDLAKAAETGSFDSVLTNLDPDDAARLQKLLADPKAAGRLLATPEARKLFAHLLREE